PNLLDRYLLQPAILRTFGWRVLFILTKDWYHNPEDVLTRIDKALRGETVPDPIDDEPEPAPQKPILEAAKTSPILKSERSSEVKSSSASSPRRFELISGSSRKFWEISLTENSF